MPKQPPVDQHDDELEEQEDFDPDVDADADDDADDVDARIQQIVNARVGEAQKTINAQLKQMSARIDDHDHRIVNLEKTVANLSGIKAPAGKKAAVAEESTGLDKFLDVTLGTAGRMGHAVVDTVAFVGESIVDIVTLGRARVNKG